MSNNMNVEVKRPNEKQMKRMWYSLRSKIKVKPPKSGIFFKDYDTFEKWYLSQYEAIPKCHYCEIPEPYIKAIYWDIRKSKRPLTRVRLELDRLDPNGNYNPDNVVLACVICNNAKSDVFTEKEFARIGTEIKRVWIEIAREKGLIETI